MSLKKLRCLPIILVIYLLSQDVNSQLQVGFYGSSCGMAEYIVKEEVINGFFKNPGIAAGLVRMHFHDCFVRGCDASVLLDSTPTNTAEKDAPANNPSLRGYEVIDNAKARLEAVCQGVVSCADILAFAARDSVELSTGGLGYDVPAGRRDGRISLASEATSDLPAPIFNLDQLTQVFEKKGLTQEELVTLSGAHTIGRSHCSSFRQRLYNCSATSSQDPCLDSSYASQLKQQCPEESTNQNPVVPLDPSNPVFADAHYYINILEKRVLFTSDQALLTSTTTAYQVKQNARNYYLWITKFAAAMVKMGQIGVLTGNDGEIRANCRVVNS